MRRNGDIVANNGTFGGTVSGGEYLDKNGNSMMNDDYQFTAGYLNINGLNVGNGNFVVSPDGDVSMQGSITMAPGSHINWANVDETNLTQNSAYGYADDAYSVANDALGVANDAYDLADSIQLPEYIQETYIDSAEIRSPTIIAGEFYAVKGGDVYASMTNNAFEITESGQSVPSAVLDVSGGYSTLALGSGDNIDEVFGRLMITNSSMFGGAAAIMYGWGNFSSGAGASGMMFDDNGGITVVAEEFDLSRANVTGLYLEFS